MYGRAQRWPVTLAVTICLTLGSGALAQNMPGDVNDLMVWYKADAGVEESDGVPATQGGTVGFWRDQSGNNLHATIADPTNAPTLETNPTLGNVPVVQWGGSGGTGFSVPGASLAQGQESTYLVVFESVNETSNRRFINFTGTAGAFRNYSKGYPGGGTADPPSVAAPFDGTRAYHGAIPINDGVPHLGALRSTQGNVDQFVNGVLDTLTLWYDPVGAGEAWELEAVDSLLIGGAPAGRYVGDIAELIIYSRALSDTELTNLSANYFEPRYDFPAAGDFNKDGAVNDMDFEIQGMNFFEPGGFAQGDMTGDGFVDLLDWIELRPLLSATGGLSAAVPEPGGIALLILGGQMLIVVRRRAQPMRCLKIGRRQ